MRLDQRKLTNAFGNLRGPAPVQAAGHAGLALQPVVGVAGEGHGRPVPERRSPRPGP